MNKEQIINEISKAVYLDHIDNDDLVQIIEHTAGFLNLKTISDYAKENNISYNGVKKYRHIRQICGVKFVVDNE